VFFVNLVFLQEYKSSRGMILSTVVASRSMCSRLLLAVLSTFEEQVESGGVV
jgi:hypothetical protein